MRILFAGTPAFAAFHLQALLDAPLEVVGVVTQPDKPGKRGRRPVPSPVKALAVEHGLPVIQPQRLRAADVEPFAPDLIVVVAYGQILKREVLSLPRHGCLNVHASLLPRWRGAAPIQRAIQAGDTLTGVCLMQMDAGLDTGAVFDRVEIAIDDSDTTETLTARLQEAGAPALVTVIHRIEQGDASAIDQQETGVTYAHKVEKEEAAINWSLDAAQIARNVRAFNPDPVAFAQLGDLRIRIWEVSVDTGRGTPGKIIAADKRGIEVACGKGSIRITRLQLPVGKGTVMSAADVLNARRQDFEPGQQFT